MDSEARSRKLLVAALFDRFEQLEGAVRASLRASGLDGPRMAAELAVRRSFRRDPDLRFPHRKILDSLLRARDWRTGRFREVHFSQLVREAQVGKNRAGGYLALLHRKGLIDERRDGYRRWIRIKAELSPDVTSRGDQSLY